MEFFVIIGWLVLCAAIGSAAGRRDRSSASWFFFAFFLSPLVAGIALALLGEGKMTRCNNCGSKVKEYAKICPFCKAEMEPSRADMEVTPVSEIVWSDRAK